MGFWVPDGTQVFSGTAPTSFQDKNLSSIVGLNRAVCLLSFEQVGGGGGGRVAVRPNGETYETMVTYAGDHGPFTANIAADKIIGCLCVTDTNGIIEWKANSTFSINIILEGYFLPSEAPAMLDASYVLPTTPTDKDISGVFGSNRGLAMVRHRRTAGVGNYNFSAIPNGITKDMRDTYYCVGVQHGVSATSTEVDIVCALVDESGIYEVDSSSAMTHELYMYAGEVDNYIWSNSQIYTGDPAENTWFEVDTGSGQEGLAFLECIYGAGGETASNRYLFGRRNGDTKDWVESSGVGLKAGGTAIYWPQVVDGSGIIAVPMDADGKIELYAYQSGSVAAMDWTVNLLGYIGGETNCYFYDTFPSAPIAPDENFGFSTRGDSIATCDESTFDIYLTHESGAEYPVMVNEAWQSGFNGTKTGNGQPDGFDWVISTHPPLLVGEWTLELTGTCSGIWDPVTTSFTFDVESDAPVVSSTRPAGTTGLEPSAIGCVVSDDSDLDMSRLRLDAVSPVGVVYRAIDGGIIQDGWDGTIIQRGGEFPDSLEINLTSWPAAIENGKMWTFNLGAQNKAWQNLGESTFISRYSIQLDGVDQTVSMGDVLDRLHTDSFSLSFWMKTSTSTESTIVSKRTDTGNKPGYEVRTDGSDVHVYFVGSNAGYIHSYHNVTLNDSAWHHVVVTYDGSSDESGLTIYVDGASVALTNVSNTLVASMANSAPFLVGGYHSATAPEKPLAGMVADLSSADEELSSAEALELWNNGSPDDLFTFSDWGVFDGWWRLGEGDDASGVLDHTFSANHGTTTGTIVEDGP